MSEMSIDEWIGRLLEAADVLLERGEDMAALELIARAHALIEGDEITDN